MSAKSSTGPLAGVRILDLGTLAAGPVAGTLLADFGAEVVKIEQPGVGDTMRHIGPFYGEESLFWNVEARNKKSVTIDLRKPDGQALVKRLAKSADVLIENFRPGTMADWGLGYPELAKVNPNLVMLSVSGFGQTGPYSSRAGYDRIALAFSGILYASGFPDRPPVKPGITVADYQTALYGAYSIMMALYWRDARGGKGQHIDLSLFEAMFRFTDTMAIAYDKLGIRRERNGNKHFGGAPGDHFPTSDGRFIVLACSGNPVFSRLATAMGKPELLADERYASHDARWRHVDQLNALVGEWILSVPVNELLDVLTRNGVPHSLIYSIEDIMQDPHYAERRSIETIRHPRLGELKMQGVTPRMSESPPPNIRPAPTLGEHTAEVLENWLKLSADEVSRLRANGVV